MVEHNFFIKHKRKSYFSLRIILTKDQKKNHSINFQRNVEFLM